VLKGRSLLLCQVRSTSAPSAGRMCTKFTTTPETARYLHVSCDYSGPLTLPGMTLPIQCQHAVGKEPAHCLSAVFSLLRLQKMCATSHSASRQPTVHRGVAHTRYHDAFTSNSNRTVAGRKCVHSAGHLSALVLLGV